MMKAVEIMESQDASTGWLFARYLCNGDLIACKRASHLWFNCWWTDNEQIMLFPVDRQPCFATRLLNQKVSLTFKQRFNYKYDLYILFLNNHLDNKEKFLLTKSLHKSLHINSTNRYFPIVGKIYPIQITNIQIQLRYFHQCIYLCWIYAVFV